MSCFWDFGIGGTSTDCTGPTVTYNLGSYDVSLTITDANGCMNTLDSMNVINAFAYPTAGASFGPQPTTILNSTIEFTNIVRVGHNSYGIMQDWIKAVITMVYILFLILGFM